MNEECGQPADLSAATGVYDGYCNAAAAAKAGTSGTDISVVGGATVTVSVSVRETVTQTVFLSGATRVLKGPLENLVDWF